ncbi:MAG: cation transporting ATPase C-terminal domain-containing protein [[Eubacterium] siraeum]
MVTGGVLIAAVVMTAYYRKRSFSRAYCAMAFSTLCISRLFHGFNCRSDKSIFKVGLTSNRFSLLAFLAE